MASRAFTVEIGQKLVDLGRVYLDMPERLPGPPDQVDVLADEPLEHLEYAGHGVVRSNTFGLTGCLRANASN